MSINDSVLNSYVETLLSTVSGLGVSKEQLLTVLPIEQQQLANAGSRLSMDLMTQLWQRAVALTGDHALGLKVGENIQLGAFNILGGLVLNSATAREAIEQALQYQSLVSEGGTLSLEENGENIAIKYQPTLRKPAMTSYQIEGVLCSLMTLSRNAIPFDLRPLRVDFAHQNMSDISAFESFFQCQVCFNADKHAIYFDPAFLDIKIPHADPELLHFQQNLADRKLSSFHQHQGYTARVHRIIESESDWFGLTPALIARQLKLSLRQMQRLLNEESTSYQEILNTARKNKAAILLIDTNLSTDNIAERLGYNNLSSFHRAFKRWYGVSPKEYQNRER